MSIENCIKRFLKRLSIALEIFDDDLEFSYDTDILAVFTQNVRNNIPGNSRIDTILNIIDRLILDTTINITNNSSTYINFTKVELNYLSRKKETKFRIRDFAISTFSGSIIPIKYLEDANMYQISATEKNLLERVIREVILYYGNDTIIQADFDAVFKKIISGTKNIAITIYNSDISFVKLYSKCYFLYLLNGHKTIFPSDILHDYQVNHTLINSVNTSTSDFTQFFEIYDVIDEYHHASDILIKYLKMYQIIEYFITRTLLVKIQNNTSKQNLFLREMTSLSKYDDFDKSNFKIVFKTNETNLSNWFKSKLDGNPKLKKTVESFLYPNETKTISTTDLNAVYNVLLTLIYKIRNTIVHNKESEIHLTIHNVQLRKELIILIKDLLQKLENILLKKVVDFESVITYKNKHLELY